MSFRFKELGIGLLIAALFCAGPLDAQLNRGVIEGTVTDPQGAVVPGVRVTVTDLETGVSQFLKTNSAGYYRAENLVPGRYKIQFVVTGFSPLELNQVQVIAAQVLREDAQLKLGESRQMVQITAAPPLIQTGASNASTTLSSTTVQSVPLAGRDLQQLVNLLPGVNNVEGPPGTLFGFNSAYGSFPDPEHVQGSNVSVNGGQAGANAWYLDGNLDLSGIGENMAVNPSPDAVSEFQVVTNNFAAQYGRTGGAIFNVVLKSGANQVHGDVYEFLQNSYFNARNPFTSISSTGQIIPQAQIRYNDFGGTIGGPVYIPHIYNGRDKTFFFFSEDASVLHDLNNNVYTVPTPLMRQGDFSEDPNAAAFGIWNPYSTVGPDPQTGLFDRVAFGSPAPGNPYGAMGCHNAAVEAGSAAGIQTCNFSTQIPANMLNPYAMFYINSFPLPNYNNPLSTCSLATGGAYKICQNYLAGVGSSQDSQNISLKIDEKWSDKSSFFGEWLFAPARYNNYRVPWTGPTFPMDSVGAESSYPFSEGSTIISFGNNYVFTSTLLNEFRLSFSRQFLSTHPSLPYPNSITDQLGVEQELAPIGLPSNKYFPIPHFSMSTPQSFLSFGPTGWTNMNQGAQAYTLLDNITKIMGRHTLKTGFMVRHESNFYESGFPLGLNFSGQLVQDPSTALGASGLAQFMMGAVSNSNRDSSYGVMWSPTERFNYWGFYGQDEFRIRPNFTLSYGLRYELFTPFSTLQTPLSSFCLTCMNSVTGLPGMVIYQGGPGWPGGGSSLSPANKTDFGPRINFSWAPFSDRKTVIRGGYDIFYSNAYDGLNEPGQGAANAPGWNQEYDWNDSFYPGQCAPFSGQCVAFPFAPTPMSKASLSGLPSTFPAANRAPLIGNSLIQFFTPPSHDPTIEMWNFEIERQLPGNMMVSVGYVGNHGTHLLGEEFRQFNFIPISDLRKYGTGINANVPITQFYSGQTAAELQQIYGSSTLPLTILLKPYPFYGATAALQNNTSFDGTSTYNALQITVRKEFSHGLNFIATYTDSKNIVNAATSELGSGLVDPIHFNRPGNVGGRAGAQSGGVFGGRYQNPLDRAADRSVAPYDIPQIFNFAATYQLPFGAGRRFLNRKGIVNVLLGGWQVTPNFNAESGLPLSISCPGNQVTTRCDLVGNPHFSQNRTKAEQINDWINPAAFLPAFGGDQTFWANYNPNDPRAYLYGTAGPVLPQIRGPAFWNLDASLMKDFHLTESKYFQFRWDVFNALNHQNLALPNTGWCLPPGPNGEVDVVHQAGCAFGQITNVQTDPRNMQFALKFIF